MMKRTVVRLAVVTVVGALPWTGARGQESTAAARRVVVTSGAWELVGDLRVPVAPRPVPAVLLFNQAAGDRTAYGELAELLAERGIASLRLDLRGHGESTNLGRFEPGQHQRDPLIWDAEADVIAAQSYLASVPEVDGTRLGVVAASYSGEEAVEAGGLGGYAGAYVLLSPGSLSSASVASLESHGAPWLFVVSREDPFLREISQTVAAEARFAELLLLPGTGHATDLLSDHRGLPEQVVAWLASHLR